MQESRVFGEHSGHEPRLLATLPLADANIHAVGTRVVCHRSGNLFLKHDSSILSQSSKPVCGS